MTEVKKKPIEIVILTGQGDSELDVPEEPANDDEDERTQRAASGRTTPITFFTAAGIARWMARAYGYIAKKKAAYTSQDKVANEFISRAHL